MSLWIRLCNHTYIYTDIQTYIHTDIHTYRHTYIQDSCKKQCRPNETKLQRDTPLQKTQQSYKSIERVSADVVMRRVYGALLVAMLVVC